MCSSVDWDLDYKRDVDVDTFGFRFSIFCQSLSIFFCQRFRDSESPDVLDTSSSSSHLIFLISSHLISSSSSHLIFLVFLIFFISSRLPHLISSSSSHRTLLLYTPRFPSSIFF
ncbi:hypothetical protein CPB83DRAFT_75568 [Crepidotus variabilis]|uniref:Transmembrane protein n=1 Tax=Crepidotus variabilis TaxID=179855 RepID=A0A9P6EMG6_9AGAR|nr:hypothetical protein CPB83DRAFT_75568 [Crepidotus variabilis]